MLRELSEDLNSIKKLQSETKDTLTEINNNLQGNTIEWMNLRIKSMIWNISKKQPTRTRKKRTPQNKDSPSSL